MKEEILRVLHRGRYVSGTKLAKRLKVSKVAIWKHVQTLKSDGYSIESKPRRGYRLIAAPDLLLPYEVRRGLKTKFVGREISYYKEVDSTQEIAKRLATKGFEEGTLVVAETQTTGKGRRSRNWYSPEGGVYLSIILRPEVSPSRAPLMALLAGLATAKTIRKLYKLKVELKWPNDILVNDRKVGGVLIEIAAEADIINWLVVGIGLNANTKASLPRELRKTAVSLEEECGRKISRMELVRKLLEEVEQLYLIFKKHGSAPILEGWKSMTNTLGVPVRVTNGKVIEGKAVDVDQDGALIIKLADGSVRRVVAGDVSLRRKR
ncbi:MAG: biotin--[acetyl-CoA-carboxylase] ligase [Candidatus Hadarchaeaceae archaeon]